VTAVDVCKAAGGHSAVKVDVASFLAATERMPHHQHAEAVQDGLLYRNCPRCGSTLALEVDDSFGLAA